jgi:Cys-tRNA(Pro)/Cys-tRNA(Cys) deacylase
MSQPAHTLTRRGPDDVLALLRANDISFDLLEHGPVYTCAQAAKARGVPLANELKSLLIVYNQAFAMLSLPGNCRISRQRVRAALPAHEFRLAGPSELRRLHLATGTISPLSLFGCRSLLDRKVLGLRWITTNAGILTLGLKLSVPSLLHACEMELSDISDQT